jgi:hypothetical protein
MPDLKKIHLTMGQVSDNLFSDVVSSQIKGATCSNPWAPLNDVHAWFTDEPLDVYLQGNFPGEAVMKTHPS